VGPDLTVGELARRAGVAVSTIHFYEAKGLIRGWRSAGNQRRYPRGMLRRVAVIKAAQRTGIPLAEIAAAMASLPQDRAPTAEDWRRLSAAWRQELDCGSASSPSCATSSTAASAAAAYP
jgi:MerR family redox-sensitive transcriptional activator SoxR